VNGRDVFGYEGRKFSSKLLLVGLSLLFSLFGE